MAKIIKCKKKGFKVLHSTTGVPVGVSRGKKAKCVSKATAVKMSAAAKCRSGIAPCTSRRKSRKRR